MRHLKLRRASATRGASKRTLLRPFAVFGRVPFFFYVVHFYVLGLASAVLRARFDLLETSGIWLALLALMIWPCAWYDRKKRERPNLITRYF